MARRWRASSRSPAAGSPSRSSSRCSSSPTTQLFQGAARLFGVVRDDCELHEIPGGARDVERSESDASIGEPLAQDGELAGAALDQYRHNLPFLEPDIRSV